MTRVGIVGSGQVGQTLARGFVRHGYDVRIGSRSPDKLAEFAKTNGIATGTTADVAAWADTIVLAVHGAGAMAALSEAGAGNLDGKIVIDVTNPIADAPPEDGVIRYFTGPNESLMEQLQATHP